MSLLVDEYPEALQLPADPTIKVADGLDERLGWQLPAGRVGTVNRLHVEHAAIRGRTTIMLRISAEPSSSVRPIDVHGSTVECAPQARRRRLSDRTEFGVTARR